MRQTAGIFLPLPHLDNHPFSTLPQVAITMDYRYLLISDEKRLSANGVVMFGLRKPTVD
jgi:hypothetical protein